MYHRRPTTYTNTHAYNWNRRCVRWIFSFFRILRRRQNYAVFSSFDVATFDVFHPRQWIRTHSTLIFFKIPQQHAPHVKVNCGQVEMLVVMGDGGDAENISTETTVMWSKCDHKLLTETSSQRTLSWIFLMKLIQFPSADGVWMCVYVSLGASRMQLLWHDLLSAQMCCFFFNFIDASECLCVCVTVSQQYFQSVYRKRGKS